MLPEHQNLSVGEKIRRAREARYWSQAKLANAAHTTQQTVNRIENGETQHSRAIPLLLNVLGIAESAPLEAQPVQADLIEQLEGIIPGRALVGSRDLPIFGVVEGGPGLEIITSQPVDFVKRPQPLQNVREGYGVIVFSESMVPAFRPGDIALVNPHLPPRPEDDVIISQDDHGTMRATIKSLVKVRPDAWLLRQWNPSKEFELLRREWPKCHVVVGKYSRR